MHQKHTGIGPNPSGLCQCGCGQPAPIAKMSNSKRGAVKGQPLRYISGHNGRKSPVEYIISPDTDCWVWQRATDRGGYGSKWVNGRCVGAHRYIYERERGPIPEGLVLDHLCRNPACVNPDHLEPVTQIENCLRGKATRLTPEEAAAIRNAHGRMTAKDVAAQFGVSFQLVRAIWYGRNWWHI